MGGPKVTWHGFFEACRSVHERFFERLLCDCLKPSFVEAEELIFSSGEVATSVYLSDSGHIDYSIPNRVLKGFNSGKRKMSLLRSVLVAPCRCVAEPGLWIRWVYSGNLRAVTRCSLLALSVVEFTTAATTYPLVEKLCMVYARHFVQAGRRNPDRLSDLFDNTELQHTIDTSNSDEGSS